MLDFDHGLNASVNRLREGRPRESAMSPIWRRVPVGGQQIRAWRSRERRVGGLIGGLVAVEWIERRVGVVVATGDLRLLPLALAFRPGAWAAS